MLNRLWAYFKKVKVATPSKFDLKEILGSFSMGVLIDNDPLVTLTWGLSAKRAGFELYCFSSIDSFLQELKSGSFVPSDGALSQVSSLGLTKGLSSDFMQTALSKEILVFLDSDLENGVRGEVDGKQLFDFGFKTIVLETGYPSESFARIPWISGVIGKEPPWAFGEPVPTSP